MAQAERELIEGNPSAVPPVIGTIGLIQQHINSVSERLPNARDVAFSLAYAVACEAAQTFDPANGFRFTTYLKSRLRFDCSLRKVQREANFIISTDAGSETDGKPKPIRRRVTLNSGESHTAAVACVDADVELAEKLELLEATLSRAGITAREREILLLRFGHGQTLEQIGQRFRIRLDAVGPLIRKLIAKAAGKSE